MIGEQRYVPRWGQPLTGIFAGITFIVVSWVIWYIFSHPSGVFKLYENPFVVFTAWMTLIGAWQHILFQDWPFQNLSRANRLFAMIGVNLLATWLIIFVVFDKLLGSYMMPLFSVTTQAELLNLPEHAKWESLAGGSLTMIVVIGMLLTVSW
ncbi:hypothetical protein [Desulfosporosinus fructosivorans]